MWTRCLRGARTAAAALSVLLFGALFGVFVVQIAARFVFQRPLPWTDEAAVVLYVWVILWSAAWVVPEREHVRFDLLWKPAPPALRRLMRIAGLLMVGGLAAAAVPASWDYVRFMAREGTPVLGLPFSWVFLPVPLLLAAWALRSAWQLGLALRGRLPDERGETAP